MSELLRTESLSAGYGSRPIVHELGLEVRAGELVLLLGPNGAGKTTTMLTLSGVLAPLGGKVFLDGKHATGPLHERARAGLSFVTEERSVLRGLSLRDNLRAGGVAPEEVFELFPELARSTAVKGGLLSGGEQQMLTLGRALCRRPRLLLADELSLGLAPLVVTRLFEAVREASRAGTGVLLVEQHARTALKFCDRVVVMSRGRVELDLPAAEASARMEEIQNLYMSHDGARAH